MLFWLFRAPRGTPLFFFSSSFWPLYYSSLHYVYKSFLGPKGSLLVVPIPSRPWSCQLPAFFSCQNGYSRLQQESKGGFCLWSQPGTKGSRAVQTSLYRTTAPLISASCASEFCQGLPEPPHGGAERCGRERAAGGRGGTGERAARVREGRVRGGRRAARAPCRRVPAGSGLA